MKRFVPNAETVAGIAFMAGLVLVTIISFMVDEDGYRLSDPYDRQYRCRFRDSVRLEAGDTVRQCGLEVGRIDGTEVVSVDDHFEVEVTFSMKRPYIVREDSEATVASNSLLTGSFLSVDPGSPDSPELQPGGTLRTARGGSLAEAVVAIDRFLDELPDGGVGRMFLGRDGLGDVNDIIETLASDGGMGKWMLGTANQKLAADMTYDLRAAVTDVRRGTEGRGVLARLLLDGELGGVVDEMVSDLRSGMRGVRKLADDLVAGKSALSRLAVDEELGEKVDEIFTGFGVAAHDLHKSKSLLARLIRDEELGDQMASAMAGLQDFTTKLASGDNTITRLVNSPEAHDELVRLIRQATEAIEDTREGYPIGVMSGLVQEAATSAATNK